MKMLRITLQLTIEPDEFGLHALQADTRQWLTDLRDNAKGHGFTVTVDPVEDAKGLRKVVGRPRGKREPAKQATSKGDSPERKAALSVVPDVA